MPAGETNYRLKADSSDFTAEVNTAARSVKDLDKAQDQVGKSAKKAGDETSKGASKAGKALGSAAASAAKWGTAMAAAGAAATAAMVRAGLESVDALAKTADSIGITTEGLAQLRFAAQQTGVAQGEFDKSLEQMTRRLGEAVAGTGTAKRGLEELGISIEDIAKASPDKAFSTIADSIKNVEDRSKQASIAYDIFGRSGVKLLNTLDLGAEGLAEMATQADQAGLSISRIDAAKVEAANDAMARVGSTFSGVGQQLAVKFAPLLEAVADRIFGVGQEAGGVANVVGQAFDFMMKAAGFFGDSIAALSVTWNGFKLLAQTAFKAVAQGLNSVVKFAIDAWNKLPWNKDNQIETMTFLDDFIVTMESEIVESRKKIDAVLSQPLPSEQLGKFVVNVERAMDGAALITADTQEEIRTELGKTDKAYEKQRDAIASMIEEMEWENAVLKLSERDRAIIIAQRKLNATATQEERERVAELTGALYDAGEAERLAAEEAKKAAKETESAWDKALQGMVERIDSSFVDTWKQALDGNLDSFKDFGRSILDSAKQLFAELLHLNLTRPLVQGFAGAFSLGSSSTTVAGDAGASGDSLGSLSSLLSVGSLGQGAMNALWSISPQFAGSLYGTGSGITGALGINASAGTNFMAGGLANLGAGLAGNFLASKLFGDSEYGGIGGTLGGIAGSFVGGPLGAAVGSFLGNGLGSLFGGGESAPRTALDLNFATGSRESRAYTSGNEMAEGANAIADQLFAFAQGIGGSSADLGFWLHSKRGLGFVNEGKNQFGQDVDAFMDEAFNRIVNGSENLTASLKNIINAFDGTAEETLQFAQSVVALSDTLGDNPVQKAIEDFGNSTEVASNTLFAAYNKNVEEIRRLTNSYDGSSETLSTLAQNMLTSKQAAYQLAMGIQQMGQELGKMFASSAQQIRESVMTDQERVESWRAQRRELREALGTMIDPDEINQAAREIDRLNNQIFQSLSEEAQATQAEAFARYAERADEVAQRQLDRALDSINQSQESLNNEINRIMRDSAQQQQEAADVAYQAAVINRETMGRFQSWFDRMATTRPGEVL